MSHSVTVTTFGAAEGQRLAADLGLPAPRARDRVVLLTGPADELATLLEVVRGLMDRDSRNEQLIDGMLEGMGL